MDAVSSVGRFNHHVVDSLVEGAVDSLTRHGDGKYPYRSCAGRVGTAPGREACTQCDEAGCGDCPRWVIVAARHILSTWRVRNTAINHLQLEFDTPVANGVLTVESIEQAIERAGTKAGKRHRSGDGRDGNGVSTARVAGRRLSMSERRERKPSRHKGASRRKGVSGTGALPVADDR